MNVWILFFFIFIMIKIGLSKKFEMQWFFYNINLVTSLFYDFSTCYYAIEKRDLKKKSENSKGKHTLLISLSIKLQLQMCIQIQAIHQLIVKFLSTNELLLNIKLINFFSNSLLATCLFTLSSNIPFFLLTTIHLIFFAKLKSSNLTSPLAFSLQPHGKYSITHDFTLLSSNKSQNYTTSTL